MVKRARRGDETVAAAVFFLSRDGAVRPLLGHARAAPQPAFRDLLSPGHRLLHRARHHALRARHAGRTQGEPRLRSGHHLVACTGSSTRASARPSATTCGAKATHVDEYAREIDTHVPYRDARRAARSKTSVNKRPSPGSRPRATANGFRHSTRRSTNPRACWPPAATFSRPPAGRIPARHLSLVFRRPAGVVVVARPARGSRPGRVPAVRAASRKLCEIVALR